MKLNFKNWILAGLVLAIAAPLFANRFEVGNIAAVISKENKIVLQSVVRISQGQTSGSGIFVSPYHVLTAAHVLQPMDCEDELKIQTLVEPGPVPKAKGRQLFCDDIIFIDEALDIALFVTDRAVRDYLHLPDADLIDPKMAITSLGYTTSGHLGRSDQCSVSSKKGSGTSGAVNFANLFMSDCLLSPGMSGGPVIDYSDKKIPKVIGVNSLIVKLGNPGPTKTGMGRLVDAINKYKDDFAEVYDAAGSRWKNIEE